MPLRLTRFGHLAIVGLLIAIALPTVTSAQGAPEAGVWYPEYALELARNAHW